jgi:cyclophilin family peptidyl-prolyl cis-trans isomerase
MIQGGDPASRNPMAQNLGMNGPGFTLPDEVSAKLRFDKGGMLAMANKGPRTHSAGSQFFITEAPVSRLDGGYAIFGECDGVDVVSAITRVPRGPSHRPDKPVAMTVKIYKQ